VCSLSHITSAVRETFEMRILKGSTEQDNIAQTGNKIQWTVFFEKVVDIFRTCCKAFL
jgi:hypothetical protein